MENEPGILHTMNDTTNETQKVSSFSTRAMAGVIAAALALGILSGFIYNKFTGGSVAVSTDSKGSAGDVAEGGQSAGIKDSKTFKDKAEGVLRVGGFEGEGSYHIEQKPKQPDQNAYLTSTTVDLSQFVGKKIRVWGQTFEAEKAGWLMDVGYIEVIK